MCAKVLISLIFLISYPVCNANAQTEAFSFKTIDNAVGLPDNSVNTITQDYQGFIWFGTANGLCRYDGWLCYNFRHKDAGKWSISDNNIHKILPVRGGLWISNDIRIEYFSFKNGIFIHSPNGNNKITGGRVISMITVANRHFATTESSRVFELSISDNGIPTITHIKLNFDITAICKIPGNRIFAVGNSGVYLLKADGHSIISQMPAKLPVNFNTNVFYSKITNTIYVGHGFGTSSQTYTLKGNKIIRSNAEVPPNLTSTVDYHGKVTFGCDGQGITIGKQKYTSANSNISGDAIYSMMTDRNGNLWAGTYRTGANLLKTSGNRFTVYDRANGFLPYNIVTAVLADQRNIYAGLDGGGFCIINKNNHGTRVYKMSNSVLPSDNVISLTKGSRDIWMAMYNHNMARYNPQTGSIELVSLPSNSSPWVICYDNNGHIWALNSQICIIDEKTGKATILKGLKNLGGSSIFCRGDFMYIASHNNGIYVINKKTLRIKVHYTLNTKILGIADNCVNYIYVDRNYNIWFTPRYGGLYRISNDGKRIKKYNEQNGLTNDEITAITVNAKDEPYIATKNGLFWMSRNADTFVRIDEDEKIPTNYNYNASCTDGNNIYFGSMNGLVTFGSTYTGLKPIYSRVSLMSLEVITENNAFYDFADTNPRSIKLHHDQNFFNIRFSVPEYESPRRVHFSCYLKGLEGGWRDISERREISYTSVPPGNYEFYVRCTDRNGQWTQPTIMHITVLPPWYLTWWARLLFTIFIIGILYSVFRFYLHELRIKHNIELAEVEKDSQRALDDAKMSFYTNITHELRTPVFLIAAQLEELLDRRQSVTSVSVSYLQAMHRNAIKLNKLISRAIDFRKMDKGKLQLQKRRQNIVDFASNLSVDYTELCEQKNINFKLIVPEKEVVLDFDHEKLEMILNNLVSNAYKYTKDNGHITLTITDKTDSVVFCVKDDGIGIDSKVRTAIFESFFRSKRGQAQSAGDGIGLAFVKYLIELHGGHLHLESEINKGSEFSFDIPITSEGHNEATILKDEKLETSNSSTEPSSAALTLNSSIAKAPNPAATHSILLIDDERETVALLERYLISEFKIYKAFDGEEGLKQAAECLPDLIICDMMMPNLDGIGFLKKLKEDKKLQHIKVIIFTGQTSEDEMADAFEAGADAYLTKPVSLKLLRTRIDKLIAQSDNAGITADISKDKKSYTKEEQIFLLRCREIIDDNLKNPDFNIDFMADSLAMSHSALYKKLKQMTGMSLIEFINDYKIYKAVQMFKDGQTSVESVCEQCGFGDTKNFRTLFKRKIQITPKLFIQNL